MKEIIEIIINEREVKFCYIQKFLSITARSPQLSTRTEKKVKSLNKLHETLKVS